MSVISFYFDDNIDEYSKDIFIQTVIGKQRNHTVTEIIVFLRSTGGEPAASFALYDFLRYGISDKIKTTVFNAGRVSSAAVNFYMAFQERYCIPESTFMIHNTYYNTVGGDHRHLTKYAKNNLRVDNRTRSILTEQTGGKLLTHSLVMYMDAETTFSDVEAVNNGIAHAIKTMVMPHDIFYITAASRSV